MKFLQQLLAFAFLLHQAIAQSPPGFISLDCGLRGSNGYNDSKTGLLYTADDAYVKTGKGRSISPEFTGNLRRQFKSVRSFPGSQGSKNCYTFRPLHGKDNKILLRVAFLYGNYDGENKLPQFDVYLGVDFWMTVKILSSKWAESQEILHIPTSDYLYLCLVNKGLGTPFISLVELRPFDPSRPMYNTTSGSLELVARWDLGSDLPNYRYKDDPFDRIWNTFNLTNTTIINTTAATSLIENAFYLPPVVMRTANQLLVMNDSFTFRVNPDNYTNKYYLYLHFAEFVANSSREMNVYINGYHWHGPFVTSYLSALTVGSNIESYIYDFTINATSKSKLPAMVNAFELYLVKQFMHSETDLNDVGGIYSIKEFYGIRKNWEGDPCLPESLVWIGINCSYTAFDPPNIISLDLSSSKLVGTIAPSLSNLSMLQSLDLSNNNLTGEVPDFLSWLPSLTHLYLQGNNFTGEMPPALLQKSANGSLTLSFDVPANNTNIIPDDCANDACKKKKSNSTIVPIVASVAGVFAILLIVSTISYLIVRRKQRDTSIEPQLRQLSFSEVMNMIQERKLLGEGGFGNVYQGRMDGVQVAVKVLKVSPEEQTTDFKSEVKILATVHHTNLTRILGYCNEGINRAIIFELMENGNLMTHLSENNPNVLSWETRLSILHGAAQGLEYLHHGCDPPIIHRDIKPENILLTRDFVAKLADFGLSRIFPVQTARIMGTLGYLDPQYDEPSMLTEKVDVYSFGVVMLVVLSEQPAIVEGTTHITRWLAPLISTGDIRSIMDPRLQQNYDVNIAWRVLELGMACVSRDASDRPNMHNVVRELNECLLATATAAETPQHADDAALITPNMGSVFSPGTR